MPALETHEPRSRHRMRAALGGPARFVKGCIDSGVRFVLERLVQEDEAHDGKRDGQS